MYYHTNVALLSSPLGPIRAAARLSAIRRAIIIDHEARLLTMMIMTTMTRLVVKQRTTIGTLKAIGFSQSAIMVHYISYSVVIALLGCILGAVSGWWTLGKYLHVEMNKYYSAPYSRMQVSVNVVLAILFICLMAGLTNYFSCRKLLILHAS